LRPILFCFLLLSFVVWLYFLRFVPLLIRAHAIMDGTADPAPSVELDGELSRWSFQYETSAGYSDAVMADVSPIFVTGVSLDGLDEATLTVTFDMRYYAADGPVITQRAYG
jgi:hypothetical protein